MSMLLAGALLLMLAVGALAFALLGDSAPRVPKGRRRAVTAEPDRPWTQAAVGAVSSRVDVALKNRSWVPIRAEDLEAADVKRPLSLVVITAGLVGLGGLVVGSVLVSWVFGVLLAILTPFGLKAWLGIKVRRRKKAFAGQLDTTLRIVASALRAGQSLPMALASVAADAAAPMGQELGRVVNETRVGRDLVDSLLETAARMESDDLRWFAEAVEVQRDTGGNLNDIIDVVAETIRDRAEIREKINAYASEGKASAWVLMLLPVGLAGTYAVMSPGYMDPLFSSLIGGLLLALSVVLYIVSFFWMRAIVNIKV
ncbi:MAG: type II secretion system F family protein [Aeromicrobium erythreum]